MTLKYKGLLIMLFFVCCVLIICVLMLAVKALFVDTVYDKILVVNAAGSCVIVLVALSGLLFHNLVFIDLALVYAFISFISTLAFTRFLVYGSLRGNE